MRGMTGMIQQERPVVLASQSPRRRELLARVVPEFSVCPADVDETVQPGSTPEQAVADLARRKARAVSAQCGQETLVIAADTIVVCDGAILGKPADEADAVCMLHLLSGRTHQVMTAVCVRTSGHEDTQVSVTDVTFRALHSGEAEAYAACGEPLDKAGAYGIQGRGGLFVSRISGDYYGVMGLPICMLAEMLRQACGEDRHTTHTQKG